MPRHGEQIDAPSISLYSFLVSPFSTPVCHYSPSEWSNKTVGGNFGRKSNRWMQKKLQTDSDARIRIRKCTEVHISYAICALNKAHKANDASSWWLNDCMMMWLHEICLVYLPLQLFAQKEWFSLFFTKTSPTDARTDRATDRPTDQRTDGRICQIIEMRGRI